MINISIVILTFNSRKLVNSCLSSVFMQDHRDCEVIVVDNGSKDGTTGFIRENYPQAVLIQNSVNYGAAKARNQGIGIARGSWVLTLDCDTDLKDDFLSEAREAIKKAAGSTGMIQPKILRSDKKNIYSCGIYVSFFRRFYDIGSGEADSAKFGKEKNIFGVCSAAALYSKVMLEKIKDRFGYFDERFIFLFEDADLSWRARKKGWQAIFYPQLVCYHCGGSSGIPHRIRQYLCLRNRFLTLLKNGSLAVNLLSWVFYDIPRLFLVLIINPNIIHQINEVSGRKKEKSTRL